MKILAVSSGGGHWVQLKRLREAFEGHEVVFASVSPIYRSEVPDHRYLVIRDATRWNKWGLALLGLQLLWTIVRERPRVVVSTGAAPGFLAIRIARVLRRRTVWVDSMANVEKLSLSGRMIGPHCDLWLTQWPELAVPDPENRRHPEGPEFAGSVFGT
ncbi:MAG: UDP-N-acetylglucosamine--LPS N-acetylglucosamine transferase [Planctomycetes bacterium]|nr:UDP-N-acetylglucosamine--LPS N-acetylglucosamine transferase [Planctomycetota bacterium]